MGDGDFRNGVRIRPTAKRPSGDRGDLVEIARLGRVAARAERGLATVRAAEERDRRIFGLVDRGWSPRLVAEHSGLPVGDVEHIVWRQR